MKYFNFCYSLEIKENVFQNAPDTLMLIKAKKYFLYSNYHSSAK